MSAQIEQFPVRPNAADMRRHLEHLFGGYLDGYQDGLIELAWTETNPPYQLKHGQLFGTDQIDEMVDRAMSLNASQFCNVYVGARLRAPNTPLTGRCSASDVMVATAYYVDLDDGEASSKAAERYADTPPTLIVLTGSHPDRRAQMWWRLAEPIADHARVEASLRGIAAVYGGDVKIFDPPRVMRLAGSIAWPVKPGREYPELTRVVPLSFPQPSMVAAEHLERNYPPIAGPSVQSPHDDVIVRTVTTQGLVPVDKIVDGREAYMARTVLAVAIELTGELEWRWPTPEELFARAWPQYEPHVDIMAQGKVRGPQEVMEKCCTTLRRLMQGQVRGLETLDKVVERHQEKVKAREAAGDKRPFEERFQWAPPPPPGGLAILSAEDVLALPPVEYLVPGVVPEASVGILYGKSQSYKSFVALDLALRVAQGLSWHGRACRQGNVLYVVAEGAGGLAKRLRAWGQENGTLPDRDRLGFVTHAIQVTQPGQADVLVRAIKASALADVRLVVIDTMARSSVGLDENEAKAMGILMEACDKLKRDLNCAVIGVDHTGKDEELGIRGSYAKFAAADFVLKASREDGVEYATTLALEKQKDDESGGKIEVALARVEWDEQRGLEIQRVSSLVPRPAFRSALAEKHPNAMEIEMLLREVAARWQRREPFQEAPNSKASIVQHMVDVYGAKKEYARYILKDLLDDSRDRLGADGRAPALVRQVCWDRNNNKVNGLCLYNESEHGHGS